MSRHARCWRSTRRLTPEPKCLSGRLHCRLARLKLSDGMPPTDEELVVAVQGGDSTAFDVLVRRWDRKIQGAAFRVLGSDDEARDVSQEAFLKAFRGLRSFKREARFSSWLYQIAMNLCRDRLRRRRGR